MKSNSRSKKMKKFTQRPILITVMALIAIIAIVIIGHDNFFWFTPAASQRQQVQNFFNDADSGNFNAAYELTTPDFQHNNTYAQFADSLVDLKGLPVSINYKTFLIKGNRVNIIGTLTNKKNNKTFNFSVILVNSANKQLLDDVIVAPATSKT